MTSRVPFYFLISMLVIVGITLSIMRHQDYGVPWTPGESRQVWDIEAVSYTHLTLPTTPYV